MTINLYPKNEVRIVNFIGTKDPKTPMGREITHVELSDGRTIPVSEVTPRMWKLAGLTVGGGFSNEH